MREIDVANRLRYEIAEHHEFRINNIYLFSWESDFISITKSGYLWEYEIKLTKADFYADFKKKKRHKALTKEFRGYKPNKFYYVFPAGMVPHKDVPKHLGIIEFNISETGTPWGLKKVREAAMLSNKKFDRWHTLAKKFYYQNINLLMKIKELEHGNKR